MSELPVLPDATDTTMEQVIARDQYYRLRDKLVALQCAPQHNAIAIDATIEALATALLTYKATHGRAGNHSVGDPFL